MHEKVWVYARSHRGIRHSTLLLDTIATSAKDTGYIVVGCSADDGSKRNNPRPGLKEAFCALSTGQADAIYVDRLRHISSSEVFLYLFFRKLQGLHSRLITSDYYLPCKMDRLALGERILKRSYRTGLRCPW